MEKISGCVKKLFNEFKYKEYIIIIAVVLISMPVLFYPGFIYTHDGIIHLYRTAGAYLNIKNLDIFNGIYYNVAGGEGYGWGIFYPALSSIVPAIFMLFKISLFSAEKIFMILAAIFAGIFSYKMFNELFKNKFIALLCTVLYVLSPYKINQSLIRGAMGEILVFTFFPLVMHGIIKILNKEYKYKYLLIIGTCGLIYSHIISTVYAAIFVALYLILNIKKVFVKKTIIHLFISLGIILLISMPVFIPLIKHQTSNLYKINETITDVSDRVVHPGQLLMSSIEDKTVENTSYFSNEKEMNYMLGLTAIIILLMLPFAVKKIKENGNLSDFIKYSILLIISVCMMILPFVWKKFDILNVIQYPWRILSFSVLYITILAGYILKEIINEKTKYAFFIFVVGFSMLFVFKINTKVLFAKNLNQDFDFYNQTLSENTTDGDLGFSLGYAHEYLPNNINYDKLKTIEKKVYGIDIDVKNIDYKNDKNKFTYKFENEKAGNIELPLVFYYGYDVKLNGKKVDYSLSDDGFIKVKVENIGQNELVIKWNGGILYIVSIFISISTIISYIVIYKIKNKKGATYEKKC